MKPLTRYAPALEGGGPYAADYATMLEDERGSYYAKAEADARIAELGELVDSWMNSATTRAHQLNAAEKRIAELEAERDAARADAERLRETIAALRELVADVAAMPVDIDAAIAAIKGEKP